MNFLNLYVFIIVITSYSMAGTMVLYWSFFKLIKIHISLSFVSVILLFPVMIIGMMQIGNLFK